MNSNVKNEEFVPLAEFLMVSFERDQKEIEAKFKKLDGPFMEANCRLSLALFTEMLDIEILYLLNFNSSMFKV